MSTRTPDLDTTPAEEPLSPEETTPTGAAGEPSGAGGGPEFSLRVSTDQVSVHLDCADPLADLEQVLDQVMKKFTELHLPQYPDRDLTRDIIQSASQLGDHLVRHALIVGLPPVPPEPGRLEWCRDFFAEGWAVDGSDRMDFWEPMERRSVAADEELCRALPPVPGVPGLNVYGKEIPVPTLKPAKLRAGKNVTESEREDGARVFTAAIDGRLRYAKDTVTVDDMYVIKGDVSLETGNIHHKGAVTVHGDVRSGALIETDGDVTVRGLVEAATIRCGGDLAVGGGIVGDGEGVVSAGGKVEALYISEARVSAGGDVVVKNEIAHADIDCRGRVRADKGRIAGGRTVGLQGIRVAEAGAGGATTTHLIAGLDPDLEPALDVHRARHDRLDEAQAKLAEALARHDDLAPEQAAAQAEARTGLQRKLAEIEAARLEVQAAMTELKEAAASQAVEEIVIYEEIWSGTTVQLGSQGMVVRASVHKPRLVRRDRQRLKLVPMGENNTPDD